MLGSKGTLKGESTVDGALAALERAVRDAGRTLAERHPIVRAPLERLWDVYILAYVYGVSRLHAHRYAHWSTLDPLRVVDVDPDRITHTVEPDGYPEQARGRTIFPTPKFKHAGTVRAGNWDHHGVPFEDTELYRSFEAHYDRGVFWPETAFFRTAVDLVDDGVELWGCTSRADLVERCERVDALYREIDENGYRSQAELHDAGRDGPIPTTGSHVARLVNDEVTVCVDRHGRLRFLDGRNRLAIAKLLDLDAIPVWVLVRHRRWQQFREHVARDGVRRESLPERLRDHPDLEHVYSSCSAYS